MIAGDYNFASDSDEIVRKLSKKKYSSTRSFGSRSTTRSYGASRSYGSKKSRSIKIMKRDRDGQMQEKRITVHDNNDKSSVNLKIQFAVNSSELKTNSMDTLDELGIALNNPSLERRKIIINGHTDSDGSEKTNLKLSLKRAEAVKQYLIHNHSVSSRRIRTMGYGEGMPMVNNSSNRNKQINRRVEIIAE